MKKVLSIVLLLTLLLSVAAGAEKVVPSKTTGDFVQVEVNVANPKPEQGVVIEIVTQESITNSEAAEAPEEVVVKKTQAMDVCNTELNKLLAAIAVITPPAPAATAAPAVTEIPGATQDPAAPPTEAPTATPAPELTEEQKLEVAKEQTRVIEEYFGNIVEAKTGDNVTLSKWMDTQTVVVEEFFPMIVSGIEPGCGEAVVTLAAASVYSAEDNLAVLVGIVAADGTIIWHACEATVTEDGRVQANFPEELLLAMQVETTLVSIVRG